MSTNNNGEARSEVHLVDRIVLTYDRTADHLQVDGKCNSLELMLDILGRATRTVEQQIRAANAMQLQNTLHQMAEDRRIADELRKGR
jgi:hypothetical protein